MCDRTSILFLFIVLKIIILIIIPFIIIFLKKLKYRTVNILGIIDFALIILFIVLRMTNNSCIVNSTYNGIKNSINKNSSQYLRENNDPNVVNEIITNQIYKNNNSQNVYFFSNNQLPLSNKKIACKDGREVYMKNYGNSISSIATMLSTHFNKNIDPIEVLNLVLQNSVFDCDNGVKLEDIMFLTTIKYGVTFREIGKSELNNILSTGKIVLAEVNYVNGAKNITCDKGYIIIYNLDNSGNYHILYSNDSNNDTICSDTSSGNLSIINGNNNSHEWTYDELALIGNRFIIIEGN